MHPITVGHEQNLNLNGSKFKKINVFISNSFHQKKTKSNGISLHLDVKTECDSLRDLVPLVQFKNVKNTHGEVLLRVKYYFTLLKVTFIHGRFSRFLNCLNGTKSRCLF